MNDSQTKETKQAAFSKVPPMLFAWLIICNAAWIIFAVYASTSMAAGNGKPIMPLDDAYIHFQYAKQAALGEPYIYNPGDNPTSGATSFIYPYLLAVGYKLGFHGLDLGLWAMGIGALALLASTWLVYLLVRLLGSGDKLALLFALLFCFDGAVSWHFMSGMETGLVITFTLATLYMIFAQHYIGFIITASLLALARPEGSIMTGIAMGMMILQMRWGKSKFISRRTFLLMIPIMAIFVQPAVNFALTGSASATGGQAKSILGTIPFYWDAVIERIFDNFVRFWQELATGANGSYAPIFIAPLAFIGWISLLLHPWHRWKALTILGWFIVISAAISTLDTAFWHFKRYHTPLIALLYPLAGWGAAWVWMFIANLGGSETRPYTPSGAYAPPPPLTGEVNHGVADSPPPRQRGEGRGWGWNFSTSALQGASLLAAGRFSVWRESTALIIFAIAAFLITLSTWVEFQRLYRVNIHNVVVQPLAMAKWLRENTEPDDVIAVHDVGMMRYYGERYTIDMVGLTTPGAADAWRNGPGAVAEFLMAHDPQPDYVAAYTTARGLNYLADTDIYGGELAGFPAVYDPADNVALAAEFQGIYEYDYSILPKDQLSLAFVEALLPYFLGFIEVDEGEEGESDIYSEPIPIEINVANIANEAQYDYQWQNRERHPGFTTEAYEMNPSDCYCDSIDWECTCPMLDGGRRINGEEAFTLRIQPNKDGLLVSRLHAVNNGTIDVYVNDEFVDRQWIPQIPGEWFNIFTLIPAEFITEDEITIRIDPNIPNGDYMPYHHWLFQGEYKSDALNTPAQERIHRDELVPVATYQGSAFTLFTQVGEIETYSNFPLVIDVTGKPEGDYKVFLHFYSDVNSAPTAQKDQYLFFLPGNWLPGTIADEIEVDLSELPSGTYQVAIGFYNPYTFERLMPTAISDSVTVDENSRRLFIGEIEIP